MSNPFNSPPVTITQSISMPLTPTEPLPSATSFGFERPTKEDSPEPRRTEYNSDLDSHAKTRRLSSVSADRRVARLSCDLIMAPDDDKKQPQNARIHVQQPVQNPKQYLQHKRDSQFFEPIATPAGKHSWPFPNLQGPSNGQTVDNIPPEVMALARELYDDCGTAIKAMKVALEDDYAGILKRKPQDEVHAGKFSPLLAEALLFLEDEEAIAAAVKRSSSLNSIPRIRHVANQDPQLCAAPNASFSSIAGIRGEEGYPTPRPALARHLQRAASHSKFGASMLTSTEDLTWMVPIGSADLVVQEGQLRPLGTIKTVSSGSISPPPEDVNPCNNAIHDDCESKNGFSTLRYALERDAFTLAELLLRTSNFTSEEVLARHPDNGETVLHLAVLAAQAQLVKLLLDVGKADPNAVAEIRARKGFYWARGTTPLHCVAVAAAGAGPKANAALCEIIHLLLPYNNCEEHTKKADPNALNGNRHTALYLATSHFHDRVVIEELLSRGCDPNIPCPHFGFYNGSLEYPLQVASMHCKSDIGELLLRYGANPDVADTFAHSVLLQQITLLPSWQCNGVRHESNRVQGLPFIHALLRHGASISQKVDASSYATSGVGCGADNFGRIALHLVASHDEYPDVASLLLSYGVDVEAADKDGRTALHVAAFEDCANIVRVLVLEGGANVKAVCNDGLMPRLHGRLISQLSGLAI